MVVEVAATKVETVVAEVEAAIAEVGVEEKEAAVEAAVEAAAAVVNWGLPYDAKRIALNLSSQCLQASSHRF